MQRFAISSSIILLPIVLQAIVSDVGLSTTLIYLEAQDISKAESIQTKVAQNINEIISLRAVRFSYIKLYKFVRFRCRNNGDASDAWLPSFCCRLVFQRLSKS